ncbi:MAG: Gfo/Idh/MocA family oxidoreductase [Chloroflexota bacterium]
MADLDRALAERVARANGIPRVYPSADALVEGERDLDAVVVVTRKEHHLAAALPVLERGIATLVEKPLASIPEAGRRLVETAKRTGVILEEMIHFLDCAREGRQLPTSGQDALRDLELCARIVDASLGPKPGTHSKPEAF